MTPPFTIGQAVRYKPGYGTYGYEDDLDADGRMLGTVRGFTPTGRVRVELVRVRTGRDPITRALAPDSLQPAHVE